MLPSLTNQYSVILPSMLLGIKTRVKFPEFTSPLLALTKGQRSKNQLRYLVAVEI